MEIRPTANFRPSFAVQDEKADEPDIQVTRMVKETAKVGSGVGACGGDGRRQRPAALHPVTTMRRPR